MDEAIINSTASEEVNQSEQPILSRSIEPSVLDQAEATLPEKFKGKSVFDVADSYKDLESEYSRTRAQMKELEEKARKVEMYEQALNAQQFNQQQPIHSAPVEQVDQFNKLWEVDPALAVKTSMTELERKIQYAVQDIETKTAYERAKATYEDFSELEPVMSNLARQLLPMVRPEHAGSPVTIDVLYKLARATTEQQRLQKMQEQGAQKAQQMKKEKNSAYMEGSSPVGGSTKRFEDLSLEEMARELGRVNS